MGQSGQNLNKQAPAPSGRNWPLIGLRLVAATNALLLLASCGRDSLSEIIETRLQLGTTVTITILHADEALARSAMGAAFNEIERIERLMSSYDENSEIWRLNNVGVIDSDPDIIHVLERARHFYQISDGAFDITVQPLLELFDVSFSQKGRSPSHSEIEAVLEKGGFDRIKITDDRIYLPEGMKVTLGGIAKGYAIDCSVAVLQGWGVEHGLVNAGGDMRSIGSKGGMPWTVALQNPRDRQDYIAVLLLEDSAVATSGDYERFFDPEKKFHHIIDPRTGYSAAELMSVTIVAETALEADALATAVFVSGASQGMELVESLGNVEALIITADGRILVSTGLHYSLHGSI